MLALLFKLSQPFSLVFFDETITVACVCCAKEIISRGLDGFWAPKVAQLIVDKVV
jgi:hypothetical protein